jgi:signal transduction histidine kinase
VRSWMGVPLIAANDVVGVMSIASATQEDRYSERDLSFCATIAAQVAIALMNARLYERLRKELIDRERAAEELREAKETAEHASRAKSTFLANMSHELRTPLTGIIGYSELLEREAAHFGYENFVPDLHKIRTAGTHLLAIINDILDLSKIESGKMQLFIEPISIQALLDDVRVTASPLIAKNNNLLEIITDEQIGMISTDLTKARQIILNLVSNAAKFTEDGRVEIRAQRLSCDNTDWIRVSISDTGIGISEQQLALLFQEFTQADASMTRRYGGTGLGLALSRRLCQLLGGQIEVVSRLGVGSTFTVWVPASLSAESAAMASMNSY